ncbi:hypothetical protein J1605_006926 [Eschrichtius robustus]|uniref:Uncharacterized protein n=1 Tax=Eschrichtius robustus TaxID=9764 RepID=A0AB34GZM7_ESCRO|nr:hypothetical protein J1605_006926 [Eschrichtius robustus]
MTKGCGFLLRWRGSSGDTEARRGCVVCRLYLSKAVTFFKNNHETRVPRDGWVKETGPCDRRATAHLSRAPAPAAPRPVIRAAPPTPHSHTTTSPRGCGAASEACGRGHLCPTCPDHTAADLRKAQLRPRHSSARTPPVVARPPDDPACTSSPAGPHGVPRAQRSPLGGHCHPAPGPQASFTPCGCSAKGTIGTSLPLIARSVSASRKAPHRRTPAPGNRTELVPGSASTDRHTANTTAHRAALRHQNKALSALPGRQEHWSDGTSLVAQWLRIRLPMQGTRVRSLVREDPTCRRATKPLCHNY